MYKVVSESTIKELLYMYSKVIIIALVAANMDSHAIIGLSI